MSKQQSEDKTITCITGLLKLKYYCTLSTLLQKSKFGKLFMVIYTEMTWFDVK